MNYLKDSDGKPSLTATAFALGFVVCTLKLILSDVEVFGLLRLGQFSGSDYAMAIGALGALYWARRNAGNSSNGKNDASN